MSVMPGFDFGSIGSFLGPVGSILGGIGGFLGRGGGADLAGQQQFSMQQLQMQEAFQREMAQNSIQWRVADAQKAGISPLAALGAPTFSPTVSAPGVDYGASGGGPDIGRGLANMGANLRDLIGKTMTAEDKANEIRKDMLFQQQVKSNDMDIALKGARLAQINKTLQSPGAANVNGSDGLVKIVPDKVIANQGGDNKDVTAGVHPESTMYRASSGGTYLSPNDPAVINNPSITNPFLLRYLWNGWERFVDRNITNPIRSAFGWPEYQRGN